MEKAKKELLENTYQKFMKVGLESDDPNLLEGLVDQDVTGFGTAIDEKILGIEDFKQLMVNQKNQSEGIDLTWRNEPVHCFIAEDENTAVFAEDIYFNINTGEENLEMYLRFSIVLTYSKKQWKVVHWHGSKPEQVESEKDTWGIESYKQKAEELQKLVDEKTADLLGKNRELEIEAALERVRAKAMAMEKSDELAPTASVLFQQLKTLGITTYSSGFTIWDEKQNQLISWMCNADGSINPPFIMPIAENEWHQNQFESWQREERFLVKDFSGEELQSYFKYLQSFPMLGLAFQKSMDAGFPMPKRQIHHVANFASGNLLFITLEPMPEVHGIFQRFAKVFEQTYTRFLDLQKAEAQAREAQVEAALERVRAQTMAMHSSEDVGKCIIKMFSELTALGVDEGTRFGIGILNHNNENNQLWTARRDGEEVKMHIGNLDMTSHPLLKKARKAWKEQVAFHQYILEGQDLLDYYQMLNNAPDYKIHIPLEKLPKKEIQHCFIFEHGFFYAFSPQEFQYELIQITQRFSSQFAQTYRRYLDLKKAEEQAREAQIETVLERIRSKSLAMYKTDDLGEVVKVVFEQMQGLSADMGFASVSIFIFQEGSRDIRQWIPISDGVSSLSIPYFDHPISSDLFDNKDNGADYFAKVYTFEEKNTWLKNGFEQTDYKHLPEEFKASLLNSPGYAMAIALAKNSGICIPSFAGKLPSSEDVEIMKRVGNVFEQTYTRFLDLQKAEAQAREARIEAALEKVRSRTMGMQSSAELPEVANLLFLEVQGLGVPSWSSGFNVLLEDKKSADAWMSSEGTIQEPFVLRLWGEASFDEMGAFIRSKETFMVQELGGKELEEHYNFMKSFPDLKPTFEKLEVLGLSLPTYQINHLCKFSNGFLLFITYEPVQDFHDIFKRFTKVFDQTYTRFLDLQKAEAQAREAKIEAALERVRSHSIGMQSAADFGVVTNEMFEQLRNFGEDLYAAGIVFCDKHEGHVEQWHSIPGGGMLSPFIVPIDLDYIHQYRYDQWKEGKELFSIEIPSDFIEQHFKDIFDLPSAQIALQDLESRNAPMPATPTWEIDYGASFKNGYILISSLKYLETTDILPRFAQVFDLTYTRFLDLQKAENQARESQIEASLERVRAKALAMHSSIDLRQTITVIFEELKALNIKTIRLGLGLVDPDKPEGEIVTSRIDEKDNILEVSGKFRLEGDPVLDSVYAHFKQQKDYFPILEGEEINSYYAALQGYVNVQGEGTDIKHYGCFLYFKEGCLYAWAAEPHSEGQISILKKFSRVVEITYRRYKDLIESEYREKEAVKQASLDRVRAEIASMRTPEDLERITPLIWKELTILSIPFIRCGVFIIDQKEEYIEAYLSSPDGQSLGVLRLPFDSSELTDQIVQAWRKGQVYKRHWDKEDFVRWINLMMEQDQIQDSSTYQGDAAPPESLDLHFVPFGQGMLYVGAVSPLDETELETVKSLAKAFAIAFSRYEDFVKLEQAKAEIESAMNELKSTQAQLIQSEKMASLGELTAGIAHEIQNPLNFVNNFSEVSAELVDEMNEELEKGDIEEAKFIGKDLKENLSKINHHGKRADAIVKGMLEHSRANKGEKAPTDLNALADEFVRLSYHGLRAKDKSFNADFKLELDPDLPKVNVVASDIGRVILNLVNNGFYAVNDKAKSGNVDPDYKPTVSVSSVYSPLAGGQGGVIQLSVQDNGPGIPDSIKEKIFQPFFTTKPTGSGTGLGLSLSYDIVKAHGGELRVKSKEGEGTVFNIKLPIV
ncbi:ATP-binding protein [Algoriphagus sp.]|uniref:ATP-binding protein n=1 Tax=Algoriphagus sp. TaxID=1872435 RepID=UPI00345B8614